MAIVVDIANEVVTRLNGYSFSMPFLARLTFRPVYNLGKMSGLYVPVVPRAWEGGMITRATWQDEIQVDVGIMQKLATTDDAEIISLMGLAEEVGVFLARGESYGQGRVMTVENDPIFSPDHLDQYRQFTSVITVTLRVMR